MEKKKLLIFHPYLAPYRIDLYNRLSKDFDTSVLLTGPKWEKKSLGFDLKEVNNNASFQFRYYDSGMYIGRQLLSLIYFKQIISTKPDVVMAHELGINTFAALLMKPFFHYKLFVTLDDSPEMVKCISLFRKLLQRIIVKYSDFILVVHPEVERILKDRYGENPRSNFIFFPIIQDDEILTGKLLKAEKLINDVTLKYTLLNYKIILFVGRLEPAKNPLLLLKIFNTLKRNDVKLVIVGSGSQESVLKKYVEDEKLDASVIFTGQLSGSSLYIWFRLADLFVLPSIHEPFGAVINEALVAGCYVIVSDRAGASSLVDNSNGKVFDYDNEKELFNLINQGLEEVSLSKNKGKRSNKMRVTFSEFYRKIKNLMLGKDRTQFSYMN